MMLFSTGLGWSVLGSLGQNQGCCGGSGSSGRTWTTAGLVCRLCMWLFPTYKNKKEEGPVGASPVAALMPKSVSL